MAQGAQRPARQQQRNLSKEAKNGDGYSRPVRGFKRDNQGTKATVAYIKRVLCSRRQDPDSSTDSSESSTSPEPLEELLPPLTSSNAIDLELYAFISVILSNFVQTWYNQITPDQEFVGEIVQIIAHCTRGLEQRLRHVDLEALLFDEVPDLVAEHIIAVKISTTTRIDSLTSQEQRIRYHTLRPHMALEPVPTDSVTAATEQENETAFSLLLVNRLLPLLLPPEDLRNPCLEVLVSEVFSELIVRGAVCNKASEPWLIWDGVAKLLQAMRTDRNVKLTPTKPQSTDRLELLGLLSSQKAPKAVAQRGRTIGRLDDLSRMFWLSVQGLMTAWLFIRALTFSLVHASKIPLRSSQPSHSKKVSDPTNRRRNTNTTRPNNPVNGQQMKRPIISMHLWSCTSQLLSLNRRMPWLSGLLSLVQWMSLHGPGQICCTNSRLDRLMSSQIHKHMLDNATTWLPGVLQAARSALFPDNALAPARIPPTNDEVLQIRRRCADAIVDAIPSAVRAVFFATDDVKLMVDDIEGELDLLGDQYINKHLIIGIVELLVVRLFPELADESSNKA